MSLAVHLLGCTEKHRLGQEDIDHLLQGESHHGGIHHRLDDTLQVPQDVGEITTIHGDRDLIHDRSHHEEMIRDRTHAHLRGLRLIDIVVVVVWRTEC